MNMKKEVQTTLDELDVKVARIKKEFIANIKSLPDNPNATQLGNNCYSIKLSQLTKHDNWTPFFHSFKEQYNFIVKFVSTHRIESVIKFLNEIVETGKYKEKYQTLKFHPEVREQLKGILA